MKLSIVVPCYNEEEGIPNLKKKIDPVLLELSKKFELELLFIDDGSKDNTSSLLQDYFKDNDYVKIIRHTHNANLGAAMRTGFFYATGDVIATMDSDCTYNPKGIIEMLDLLDENTSIVTASPYHPKGDVLNVPLYRIFLSKSITKIYRIVTGINIYTFTALFRVYKKEVVKNINFKSNDFLATAEILIKSSFAGYKIKEFPMVLNAREYGSSKIRLLRVIKSHLQFVKKMLVFRLKKGAFKR